MAAENVEIEEIGIDKARHEMYAAIATDKLLISLNGSELGLALYNAGQARESIATEIAYATASVVASGLPQAEQGPRIGAWSNHLKERHAKKVAELMAVSDDFTEESQVSMHPELQLLRGFHQGVYRLLGSLYGFDTED